MDQVQSIAVVTTAVTQGNLMQKIEIQVKGKMSTLREDVDVERRCQHWKITFFMAKKKFTYLYMYASGKSRKNLNRLNPVLLCLLVAKHR